MYCVIQEVRRKKPDVLGEHKEILPYPLEMSINGVAQVPIWRWNWSKERYERPHREAYKISLHQSFREGGAVRKRQHSVCTMSYYDICDGCGWWGDFIIGGDSALAEKLNMDPTELCDIIESKLGPLRERLEAEFHRSAEYIAHQEHRRVLDAHNKARSAFSERYDVDGDEYDRCYDVFGALRNKEYLAKIKADHKARKQSESRYHESRRSTYEQYSSGGYSIPAVCTYSEDETAILKQFYRALAKQFHPDVNHDRDTTRELQLLNRLKEQWGV